MSKNFKRRKWTKEEDEYLATYWGKSTTKQMVNKLQRSPKAISCRAHNLNLGWRTDNVDGFPLVTLPDIIGVKYDCIQKIWIRKNGMKVKKQGRRLAYVTEKDLVEFMKNHTNLWDARRCDKYYFYTYDWFNELLENERNGIHTDRYHYYTSQEDARIVFLREVKGKSYREIGEEFGVCQQAIHRRYNRILKNRGA